MTEDGNGICNDPGDDPKQDGESVPAAKRAEALLVHDVGLAPDANVDVLGSDVGIDYTRDDDDGNSDSVGDLANDGASRADGGRLDIIASEAVNDNSNDDVKRASANLEHAQGLREISRLLHLRDEPEVSNVGAEGDKNVGHSHTTGAERGHARGSDGVSMSASRRIDSDANHGDENGSCDRQARSDGHESNVLHGSRNA